MTDQPLFFHERQTYSPLAIAIVAASMIGPLIAALFFQHKTSVALPMLIIPVVFLFMIGVLGIIETTVMEDGVHISFGFYRWIKYVYRWDDIKFFASRTYRPILEFGGWGIRGFDRKKALNTKGNRGVEITLAGTLEKRTIMIGSQRPEELEAAIKLAMENNSKR